MSQEQEMGTDLKQFKSKPDWGYGSAGHLYWAQEAA